jgi:transcriptional regulator
LTESSPRKTYIVSLLRFTVEIIMALSTGYLTSRQKQIWNLKSKGLLQVDIARRLGVTRQSVHKALSAANNKVSQALEEAAKINKIRVKTVDPTDGVLVGYSREFKTDALITFSARNGVQVWYRHEGDCKNCDQLQDCRAMLLAEAEDRNTQLPENSDSMLPSKLAEILFSKIIGE